MADETYDHRIAALESRWKQNDGKIEHLDGRVSTLAENVSAMRISVETLVSGMDKMSSRINQPVNLWAVLSVFVSFFALMMLIVGGGSAYVDLRLVPLSENDAELRAWTNRLDDKVEARSALIGGYAARIDHLEQKYQHMDDLRHNLEGDVIKLREDASEAKISRRALGDYLRQVDEMGSRAWVNKPPNHSSKVEE